MEILFLGTSCAVPTEINGNSSFVVRTNTHTALFETGGDPYRGLMKAGINPSDVDIIVVSHYHADHISGYPGLLSTFSCMKRKENLTVVASVETLEKLIRISKLLDLYDTDLTFPVLYTDTFFENNFKIELFPAQHTVPSSMICCSFENDSIFYSGDTEYHTDIANKSLGCNILIHDSTTTRSLVSKLPGHSCPYEAGLSARNAKVGSLFLTHLCYDNFTSMESAVAEAQETFDGEVILPTLLKWYRVEDRKGNGSRRWHEESDN